MCLAPGHPDTQLAPGLPGAHTASCPWPPEASPLALCCIAFSFVLFFFFKERKKRRKPRKQFVLLRPASIADTLGWTIPGAYQSCLILKVNNSSKAAWSPGSSPKPQSPNRGPFWSLGMAGSGGATGLQGRQLQARAQRPSGGARRGAAGPDQEHPGGRSGGCLDAGGTKGCGEAAAGAGGGGLQEAGWGRRRGRAAAGPGQLTAGSPMRVGDGGSGTTQWQRVAARGPAAADGERSGAPAWASLPGTPGAAQVAKTTPPSR